MLNININISFVMSTTGKMRTGTTAWTDIGFSAIAPYFALPPASLQSCNICIHHIHMDYAGGRAQKVGAFGDT